jgi:hypothetical protein
MDVPERDKSNPPRLPDIVDTAPLTGLLRSYRSSRPHERFDELVNTLDEEPAKLVGSTLRGPRSRSGTPRRYCISDIAFDTAGCEAARRVLAFAMFPAWTTARKTCRSRNLNLRPIRWLAQPTIQQFSTNAVVKKHKEDGNHRHRRRNDNRGRHGLHMYIVLLGNDVRIRANWHR